MLSRPSQLESLFGQFALEAAEAIAKGEVERPFNLRCDIVETATGFWALDTHLRFVPHDLCRHIAAAEIET